MVGLRVFGDRLGVVDYDILDGALVDLVSLAWGVLADAAAICGSWVSLVVCLVGMG